MQEEKNSGALRPCKGERIVAPVPTVLHLWFLTTTAKGYDHYDACVVRAGKVVLASFNTGPP